MDDTPNKNAAEGASLFGDEPGYRVLARKYRPRNFDDLIGQEAMVRTLANAFDKPVRAHGDVLASAYDALAEYVTDVDGAYGKKTERRCLAVRPTPSLATIGAEKGTLDQLADWCATQVKG